MYIYLFIYIYIYIFIYIYIYIYLYIPKSLLRLVSESLASLAQLVT